MKRDVYVDLLQQHIREGKMNESKNKIEKTVD